MAHADRILISDSGIGHGIRAYFQGLRDHMERRRVYRRTVRELRKLNARELNDLGIHPSMIRQLAHEAAYGS